MDAIEEHVYSWEDHQLIVNYILEWLEWRRIERPGYHAIQIVLTKSIRGRNKKIRQKFSRMLNDEHKNVLDQLLVKDSDKEQGEYILTRLQHLSPSDSPTQIKCNLKKLEKIQMVFEFASPLLEELNLSDKAIRYFGEFVKGSGSSHIARRKGPDKYLHLAVFCVYQRYIFEDWMTRTFLTACKSSVNKASGKEKERLFQTRKDHKKSFRQVVNCALNNEILLGQVRKLAWMDIPALEKEKQLKQILPEGGPENQNLADLK